MHYSLLGFLKTGIRLLKNNFFLLFPSIHLFLRGAFPCFLLSGSLICLALVLSLSHPHRKKLSTINSESRGSWAVLVLT